MCFGEAFSSCYLSRQCRGSHHLDMLWDDAPDADWLAVLLNSNTSF